MRDGIAGIGSGVYCRMVLEDRVAIVTGASQGIGLEFSKALVNRGAAVYGLARNKERLDKVRSDLGDTFHGISCDVGAEDQVQDAITSTAEEAGRIDILINNAGIGLFGAVESLDTDDWHRLFDTNVHGVFYCTRAVVPIMRSQSSGGGFGGHIVNISSVAGLVGNPSLSAYNFTKFGLRGFSEALMKEVRHDGIRVTCVYPGSVATPFFSNRDEDEWKLDPENIAATVIHILELPDDNLISDVVIRPLRPPR